MNADECVGRPAVLPAHRLRQRVIRAVGERVAVDDEERCHARLALQLADDSPRAGRSRSGRRRRLEDRPGRPSRSVRRTRLGAGRVEPAAPCPRSLPERVVLLPRARCALRPSASALRASSECPFGVASLPGTSRRRVPSRASETAVAIASSSCSPRLTSNAPPARMIGPSGNQKSSAFAMKRKKRLGKNGIASGHGSKFDQWFAASTKPAGARDVLVPRAHDAETRP